METVTLYRHVGPKELALIEASGWREFPPRLPEQPIFYAVTNRAYATQIARDWNVKESGAGFVTRFAVKSSISFGFSCRRSVGHCTRNIGYRRSSCLNSMQTSLG
jgi:hypothetical protein